MSKKDYRIDDYGCPACGRSMAHHAMLAEVIPIEEWGDKTGLKRALETHRDYGDDIVRLALISFKEYLRDNFS